MMFCVMQKTVGISSTPHKEFKPFLNQSIFFTAHILCADDYCLRNVWTSVQIFFMKFLLGKKLQMTQIYGENGIVTPVTVVRVEKGVITQIKNEKKDGYNAVQLAFALGSKHINKPMAGHIKGAVEKPVLREMRVADSTPFTVGTAYDISQFTVGDVVAVSGNSKGRGFQGVVKRHGFHGAPKSHGHKHDLRAPGSIGSTAPQRVFPGMRMAGHMGDTRVTIKNLKIVQINPEEGLLYVLGAVPGHRNTLLEVWGEGDMVPVAAKEAEPKADGTPPVASSEGGTTDKAPLVIAETTPIETPTQE